jgi:peptidoglycan biosynthesis protein MviN/MurJ (putative lipid II flippase)
MTFSQMVAKQTMSVRRGFHYRPCIPLRDPELKTLFCNFIPTAVGAGVYQLTVMTDSVISSGLGEGNVSILSYAGTISAMVNSAIAGNILLYIYPKIAAEINGQQGKHKLFQYMLLFAMLMCGVVVLFVAAGYDAVRILFERGAFGPDATGRVFICVLIYLLGSPINIMRDVVYRYFYARGNTKSTFYNGVSASALNVVVSIILARFMGLYGVVLGTTVTSVFSFTSILIRMKKQYTFGGNFPFFVREMSKVAGATVLAICGCMLIKAISLPWPSLAVSVLAAVAGVLVFGVVLLAARSKVLQVELG